LALVHVIPHGNEQLAVLVSYPVGPCCAMFGILCMLITDNLTRVFLANTRVSTLGAEATVEEATVGVAVAEAIKPAQSVDMEEFTPDWNDNSSVGSLVLQDQITAYMFEVGCLIHSLLIGLTLGVATNDRQEAIALCCALTFHQLLEGIGYGSVIARARFSMTTSIIMVATYALMTPVGVAIGMGVADSYDPGSTAALATQGTLEAISGGMLLYIAMVQLMAEDFARTDPHLRCIWFRLGTYAMFVLGAACMAIIAIWDGHNHGGDAHGGDPH
jgi:ZIP zinc/iron transport family